MPVCCRCNGSGRCKGCSCSKAGQLCTNCLPLRKGRCGNHRDVPLTQTKITPSSQAMDITISPDAIGNEAPPNSEEQALDQRDPEPPEHPSMEIRSLPSYTPILRTISSWQGFSGEEFGNAIDEAYSQIVHWIPNLFMLPSGNCGKQFVAELARLFEAYAMESTIEIFPSRPQ